MIARQTAMYCIRD